MAQGVGAELCGILIFLETKLEQAPKAAAGGSLAMTFSPEGVTLAVPQAGGLRDPRWAREEACAWVWARGTQSMGSTVRKQGWQAGCSASRGGVPSLLRVQWAVWQWPVPCYTWDMSSESIPLQFCKVHESSAWY